MDSEEHTSIQRYRRAADYLAVAQIYLRDNVLLEESLWSVAATGEWLRDLMTATSDARSFRIVCPDELTSNKLGAVLESTPRGYSWPVTGLAEDIAPGGRVLETLSEHTCQGWLEGYVLTGGAGVFPCYEAFISIVDGMMNQYAKLLKQKREVPWRNPSASLNYLLTSDGWRQDHNGYSHQGPGFINALLDKKGELVRIYLPADANTLLVTMDHALRTRDTINLVIATKNDMPQSLDEARAHFAARASRWAFASTDDGTGEPDVVLACVGSTPTLETLAAAQMLKRDAPDLRVRVVNVIDLLALDSTHKSPHALDEGTFVSIFGRECPVVFAFHGYPSAVHALLFHRPNIARFVVRGYEEEGTTTTPFDMVARNHMSRHHLAIDALRATHCAEALVIRHEEALAQHRAFIRENGTDPAEISLWRWDRVLTLNVGSSSLKWTRFDERDVRIDGAIKSLDEENIARSLSAISLRIGEVGCVAHRVVHAAIRFAFRA